jgi:hypothetical protein
MSLERIDQSHLHPLSAEALEQLGFVVVAANCEPEDAAVYAADPAHTANLTEPYSVLAQSIWGNGSAVLVEGRTDHPGNALALPEGEPISWENELIYRLSLSLIQHAIILRRQSHTARDAYFLAPNESVEQLHAEYQRTLDEQNTFKSDLLDPVIVTARTQVMVDAVAARLTEGLHAGPILAIVGHRHLTRRDAETGLLVIAPELQVYLEQQHPDQPYMIVAFKNPARATPQDNRTRQDELQQRTDGLDTQELRAILQDHSWPPEVARYLADVPYLR